MDASHYSQPPALKPTQTAPGAMTASSSSALAVEPARASKAQSSIGLLLRLAPELQCMIAENLPDTKSALNLAMTCHNFRDVVKFAEVQIATNVIRRTIDRRLKSYREG
ncbi:hypothetical protein GGR56DRAFT_675131 [Xylariaceae sp. FL0804]|nr:hypothetical protein GGR56DRAFT_675131 [Xylariaceae sp. FL0804]